MKKLTKVAALFAASALAFGGLFLSCSSDGLPPELGGGTTASPSSGSSSGTTTTGSGSSGSGDTTTGETTTGGNEPSVNPVTVNAAWDFTGNARDGTAVDGVSATKGGSQPASAIELTTNKTGSGAKMTVLTNQKCEWNGKLQFATNGSEVDLFTITADAACTAVIKVGSSSSSKSAGKVNALKLGSTVIYDFDSVDKDASATEKTVQLSKGANTFSGSGIFISTVKLSTN